MKCSRSKFNCLNCLTIELNIFSALWHKLKGHDVCRMPYGEEIRYVEIDRKCRCM